MTNQLARLGTRHDDDVVPGRQRLGQRVLLGLEHQH